MRQRSGHASGRTAEKCLSNVGISRSSTNGHKMGPVLWRTFIAASYVKSIVHHR